MYHLLSRLTRPSHIYAMQAATQQPVTRTTHDIGARYFILYSNYGRNSCGQNLEKKKKKKPLAEYGMVLVQTNSGGPTGVYSGSRETPGPGPRPWPMDSIHEVAAADGSETRTTRSVEICCKSPRYFSHQ